MEPRVAIYRPPQSVDEALDALRQSHRTRTAASSQVDAEIAAAEALEARLAEPSSAEPSGELPADAEPTLAELRARVAAATAAGSAPRAALPTPHELLACLRRLDRAMRQRGGFPGVARETVVGWVLSQRQCVVGVAVCNNLRVP